MIVLDASAAVDYFRRAKGRADQIAERLAKESTVHVPAVFDLEVLQALRGLEAGREVPAKRLEEALVELGDLRATRYRHGPLRSRIWALRNNLTAYDAAYVALAELLEAPLLTSDRRLARSSGHEARIEVT